MSPSEARAILGTDAGAERNQIRRRYSEILRVQRVHEDPEAFQRLRKAYETCLAYAGEPANSNQESQAWSDDAARSDEHADPSIWADARDADDQPDLSESTPSSGTAESDIDRLARDILVLCTPLSFDPTVLRNHIATTVEFDEIGVQSAVGNRIAGYLADGVAATPHAIRELSHIFHWDDIVASRDTDSVLQNPDFQRRLYAPAFVRVHSVDVNPLDDLGWVKWPGAVTFFVIYVSLNRGPGDRVGPGAMSGWGLLILLISFAALWKLEFWALRFQRGSVNPWTPENMRFLWKGRIALWLLGVAGVLMALFS